MTMVNALIFMWSLILVVGTIVLLDWWVVEKIAVRSSAHRFKP